MEQYPKPLPRAFFAAVLVALIFLLIGGWWYYRSELKRHKDFVAVELQAIADLKTQQIADWRNERLSDANFLFLNPGIREQMQDLDRIPINSILREELYNRLYPMFKNGKYSSICVYDHLYTNRLTIPEHAPPAVEHFASFFDFTAKSGAIQIYDFHTPDGDSVHLDLVIPYYRSKDSVLCGMVVLRINPYAKLFPMLQNFPTHTHTSECVLVRADGDSVVILNELRHAKNSPLRFRQSIHSKTMPAAMAVRNEHGFREGIDYRNVPVYAVVLGIPGTSWGMVIKVDREEVDQPFIYRMFFIFLSALLFLTLLFSLGAYWWLRRASEHRLSLYLLDKEKRETEVSYFSLFENMLNGFAYCRMIFDENNKPVDFVYVSVNKAFETHTGLLNVTGKRVTKVIPGIRETDPVIFEVYGNVVLTGVPVRFEIFVEALKMWFDISVYRPTTDHFVAVFDVINERKAAEEALRSSEQKIRNTLENMLEGCQILGFDYRYLYVNAAAANFGRMTREELLGRTVMECYPGFEQTEIYRSIKRCLEERVVVQKEFEFVFPDGVKSWFELSMQPVPDGVFILSLDITERRNFIEALRNSEERLRTFFESSLFGTILSDIYGRIYEANEEFCRITGYTHDEVVSGKVKWDEITPDEFIPADTKAISEARERGACTPYEKQYIRKDGTKVWVLVGFILLGKERERSAAFVLDITREKMAEEELRNLNAELELRIEQRTQALTYANKELEAFSYSVSHDLRAPLRAIDGFSRIICEDFPELLNAESRRLLDVIRGNALKMGQLIDDLLAFSRVGRSSLQLSPITMTEMARAMYYEYTTNEQRERILFTLHPLPEAVGDPTLLRQVWANLLSNAVKFSSKKPQSQIEVSGEVVQDEIVYTVKDNGAGFDSRYHEKLFGVFQRLHSPREFEGTGVGLAIVQRVVHRHGGKVWAESVVDEGATFHFSLPVKEKQQ